MKQYRVKALSFHSDKSQVIYKAGDIINEDVLHEGSVDELIAGGWLEPVMKQGPIKPFSGTNEAKVEDPQEPKSLDKPVEEIKPIPTKKK